MTEDQNTKDRGCSITLSGKYTWEDVDQRAKQLGLIRSRYISLAVDKEIDHQDKIKKREAVMLLLIILTFTAITLQIIGLI